MFFTLVTFCIYRCLADTISIKLMINNWRGCCSKICSPLCCCNAKKGYWNQAHCYVGHWQYVILSDAFRWKNWWLFIGFCSVQTKINRVVHVHGCYIYNLLWSYSTYFLWLINVFNNIIFLLTIRWRDFIWLKCVESFLCYSFGSCI